MPSRHRRFPCSTKSGACSTRCAVHSSLVTSHSSLPLMFLSGFLQDVRIGLRVLIKEKSFCLLAVFVLALGIGGVTTMFSVINGTMLRGFSYPNADRLAGIQVVDVTQKNPFGFNSQIFALDYEAIREQQKSFEMLAAYINGATVNLTSNGI